MRDFVGCSRPSPTRRRGQGHELPHRGRPPKALARHHRPGGRQRRNRGALTLDWPAEEVLRSTLGASDGEPALAPDVETARRLVASLEARATKLSASGQPVVLLAPPDLRRPLFEFASRFVPEVLVVTARELVPGTNVEPAGTLQVQPALAA